MIISWNTTNACNMFCDHCYRDAGCKAEEELNTKEAKTLLEQIAKAGFKIMIFSVANLLCAPDIVELVEYATKLGLRSVFGTNGNTYHRRNGIKIEKCRSYGHGYILLILWIKKNIINSVNSQMLGEGAVRGMRNCKKVGLPFQIDTTVMDWNQHELEAITDFAVAEGAVAHHIFFLVPTGRGKNIEAESLRAKEYEDVITRIMKKQQEVDIELKPTCASQFMRIADQMGMKLRFRRGCLAGTSYCIISPRGKVQPCAYLNMELGDVRETPFDEIWKNSEVLNKLRTFEFEGNCGKCKYKFSCGGCRARAAYYNDGNYMAEEPWCLYSHK